MHIWINPTVKLQSQPLWCVMVDNFFCRFWNSSRSLLDVHLLFWMLDGRWSRKNLSARRPTEYVTMNFSINFLLMYFRHFSGIDQGVAFSLNCCSILWSSFYDCYTCIYVVSCKEKNISTWKVLCVGNAFDGFYWANVSKIYNLWKKIIMIIIDE